MRVLSSAVTAPSGRDHEVLSFVYNAKFRDHAVCMPTVAPLTRFDRGEFLVALEWLHAFYMSRYGLQRDGGLSIDNRPDFVGIAQWIFGAYLPARASGFDVTPAFDLMLAEITASEEWRQENPGRQPLSRVGSAAARGAVDCRGPDFLGIATWVFDVYLNERLRGMSPGTAWVVTENAIRATDEWRSKHRASAGLTSRSEGHKIDFELDAVPSVKGIELTAARRLARHPRVSWFGTSND